MFSPDAEPSRKERGHQRCEAAPPKPERRKASWGGFLKRPGTASIFLAAGRIGDPPIAPRGLRRLS